ncbi:MAG: hypothetical protein ACLU6W_15920 [Lachnospiraceae bacterium]|nr:hypothetical protein [Candidatus Fimimorpha excrementavium]
MVCAGGPDLYCVSAFGAVTLIFAILERQKVKIEQKKAEKWSVGKLEQQKKTADSRWTPGFLEPVPDKRAVISRGDSVVGCYCKLVMISSIVCGSVQIVLSAVVLKVLPIWNPNFAQEIQMAMGEDDTAVKILSHWNPDMVSNGLLTFIVLITVIEIGVAIYKTLRYGSAVKSPSKAGKM